MPHSKSHHAPIFSRLLDTVGDGSGTKNAIGDYSSGQSFSIAPAAGEAFEVHRLIVNIEDAGSHTAATYGALSALSNGVVVQYTDQTGTTDLTDGVPVTSNSGWARFAYDSQLFAFAGGGNDRMLVRWSFFKAGMPIYLDGHQSESFEVVLSDNMTGLVSQYFCVQGTITNLRG